MKNLIKYYLKNSTERKEIAQKAQKKAHNEHTYMHRMKELISTVNQL